MNCRNIETLKEIVDGECYVLDERLVADKWRILERACVPFFNISDHDIDVGRSTPRCINALFDAFDGIRVIEPLQIMSAYEGNAHGGRSDLYVEQGGQKQSHCCALQVENSLETMVEAFYAAFELPKKGCVWHGLYGRDYSLLLDERRLVAAMERRRNASSDRCEREEINRPCGIRLAKHRDSYRLSCLASYPTERFWICPCPSKVGESALSLKKSCCPRLAYISIDHRR